MKDFDFISLSKRIMDLEYQVRQTNFLIKEYFDKRKKKLTVLEENIYNLIKERDVTNPVSEQELCQRVLGFKPAKKEKTTLTVHISRIRIKTGDRNIRNLRSIGYYYIKEGQ